MTPGIDQPFPVAIASGNGTGLRGQRLPGGGCEVSEKARKGGLRRCLIADQTALADILRPDLELRLEQSDENGGGRCQRERGTEHLGERDKTEITDNQLRRRGKMCMREVLSVEPLEGFDARVTRNRRVQLTMPDIDTGHMGRAGA